MPQAGIAAPTLTVMQGFKAKKIALCISFPASVYFVYTPYTSIPHDRNPSANRTRVRRLESKHANHYTTQTATMKKQNVVFKPNVREKGNKGLHLNVAAYVTFA